LSAETVTFSFGKNWRDYLAGVSEEDIVRARNDIAYWLGETNVQGKRVLDVGSGSGIHSLGFNLLGAANVHSFDYDEFSVGATKSLRDKSEFELTWNVEQGSILDDDYVTSLGQFDIVYSWGVLHHTGAMWNAMDNILGLVLPGGYLWIALYQKGSRYEADLALKKKFNASSPLGKKWMILRRVVRAMALRLRSGKNPFAWNQKVGRGMNVYHDIVDWLGGLPYEVAAEDDVVRYLRARDFVLERIKVAGEGGCSVYVFSRIKSQS
jgi:2-polyprenyl-6-hydroxyphenyl methylase/3-demethylubiquinone-9 3-methyltransferase